MKIRFAWWSVGLSCHAHSHTQQIQNEIWDKTQAKLNWVGVQESNGGTMGR